MSEMPEDTGGAQVTAIPPDDVTSATSSRRTGILVLLGIVVAMVLVFVAAMSAKGRPTDGVLPADPVGYAAPALTLPRLDGKGPLTLADLKGKPVVVNFWASWCTTCKAEAEALAAAEKKWRDKGVVFIGIDAQDTNPEAIAYEEKYGVEYLSVVDPSKATSSTWRVTGFPETFFIGPDGRIISKFISSIDQTTLDEHIAQIAS